MILADSTPLPAAPLAPADATVRAAAPGFAGFAGRLAAAGFVAAAAGRAVALTGFGVLVAGAGRWLRVAAAAFAGFAAGRTGFFEDCAGLVGRFAGFAARPAVLR